MIGNIRQDHRVIASHGLLYDEQYAKPTISQRENAMSEIAALQNPGYFYLNRSEPVPEKTVIVVGVPRSGTSMIASALRGIGISLGDTLDGAVMEDLELASALEANDQAALAFLIERRNKSLSNLGI